MTTEALSDPRLALAVKFQRGFERPPKVVAVRSGSNSAILDSTLLSVEQAASKFGVTAQDIRTSPNMSRGAQAQRIDEAAQPFIQTLKQAASKLAAEQERVSTWAMTASYVKDYDSSTPYHVIASDQALIAKYERLSANQQASLVAQAARSPATHLRWVEAFLRTPAELSGLTFEQRHEMRVETLRTFDRATFGAIDAQSSEIEQTHAALQGAAEMLREDAPASWTEFAASDPATSATLRGHA